MSAADKKVAFETALWRYMALHVPRDGSQLSDLRKLIEAHSAWLISLTADLTMAGVAALGKAKGDEGVG